MNIFLRVLVSISGNAFIQKLLRLNARVSHYLMGIGSGAGVLTSGEGVIFDLLKRVSNAPYVVFDVGANKGQFIKFATSSMNGLDVQFHSFEPSKSTFRILEGTALSGNVTLNNIAVGDSEGARTLYYDRAGSGLASLSKRNLGHYDIEFGESETIDVTTMDKYCSDRGIDHISLLKIDIEGHELGALKGASTLFEKRAIDLVSFEFGGANIDTRTYFQDFWYFFKENDMEVYRICPSGYLYRVETYTEDLEQFRTTNFVAVRKALL